MEQRILILAPRGRDAQVMSQLLAEVGYESLICSDVSVLTRAISEGAGTALVTEEALQDVSLRSLNDALGQQPAWSDFPFILLAARQLSPRTATAQVIVRELGNVVVLERPISAPTIISAVDSALRARRRQFQMRKHLKERERAEERLSLALDAGQLGAWELDLSTWKLEASRTCKLNFGRDPNMEFTYENLIAAVHPDDSQRHKRAVLRSIEEGTPLDIEYRNVWPDGSIHWVQIRAQRVLGNSGEPRLIGVSVDITDSHQAAEALRASRAALQQLNETLESRITVRTQDLARANDRLMKEIAERERAQAALVQSQKMEAVGQLTNGIAHDFNNLLTAIVGNVDMIGRRTEDPRVRRLSGFALEAAQRASRLTGQLLAFSRSQRLDLRPVAVDDLIDGMGDLVRRSIGPSIQIRLRLNSSSINAHADANQLELAILNLVINARDAMPDGGVLTIASDVRDSDAADLKRGSYLVVSISDTGCGIAPQLQQKVFEPFFTTKPTGKGTGLGLSQVYGIAHQSGGTARLSSTMGKGTTVELWLPIAAGETAVVSQTMGTGVTPAATRGESVLVIEDDRDVRRFIVECLVNLGYQVFEADNGYVGLEQLKRGTPDLLIVDFAMPGINGAEVATIARNNDPALPIIFVTGYADMDAVERVPDPKHLLRKPFDVSGLSDVVKEALLRAVRGAPATTAPLQTSL